MTNVLIAGYVRTPFHLAHKGNLSRVRADELAAATVKALVARTGVDPHTLEDVILGNSFPEGEQGFNMARLVALMAGLPQSVAGVTINRFCGSSMQAIHNAAGMIALGAGEAYIAAGVESMSRVPMGGFNPMPNPDLYSRMPGAYMSMGETAENVARRYELSRQVQEVLAIQSHAKAAAAQASGNLGSEIIPIETDHGTVDQDGTIRPETSAEGLAGLKPAFSKDGTVTAGTSSPLTDGAAATLVCSADYAARHGVVPLAQIRAVAVSGCDPTLMGLGPISASKKALARAGLSMEEIDIVEINEAFASQALACIADLTIDPAKVNLDGGALALGHPLGATGARITGKAASLLKREGKKYALATQCIGGGQGIATVLETV